MPARPVHRAVILFALLLGAFALSFGDAAAQRAARADALAQRQRLAAQLGLTDLCLFSEARYTRHPSQADLFSAFQDHPLAFEHFPSGSLIAPPRDLTAAHETLDR
jgi:hypothetical protein